MENKEVEAIEKALGSHGDPEVPEEVSRCARQHLTQLRQRMAEGEAASRFSRLLHLIVQPRVRLAACVATAVVVFMLAVNFFRAPEDATVVFADVVNNLKDFRPYSCLQEFYKDGRKVNTARYLHPSPTQRREEYKNGGIMIWDLASVVMLSLNSADRTATRNTWPGSEGHPDFELLNWVEDMKDSPESLGMKRVEGRWACGFRESSPYNDFTVWIDPRTNLPLRFEVAHPGGYKLALSHFEFDAVMDPELFKMTPPEGYALQEVEHREDQQAASVAFHPYSCIQEVVKGGQIVESMRVMQASSTQRREIHADGNIHIYNRESGDTLVLNPTSKVAERGKERLGLRDDDQLDLIRVMQSGQNEDLGTADFNGRQAKGFRASYTDNVFTVWLDAETGLPLHLETFHPTLGDTFILRDFDFEPQFDESLFSTDAPEGYTSN